MWEFSVIDIPRWTPFRSANALDNKPEAYVKKKKGGLLQALSFLSTMQQIGKTLSHYGRKITSLSEFGAILGAEALTGARRVNSALVEEDADLLILNKAEFTEVELEHGRIFKGLRSFTREFCCLFKFARKI